MHILNSVPPVCCFCNIYVSKIVCLGTRKKTVYEKRVEIASAYIPIYYTYYYYIPTRDPSKRNLIRVLFGTYTRRYLQ